MTRERTSTLLNVNRPSEPIFQDDRIVRGGNHLSLLPHPQPATLKYSLDVHLVLFLVILWADSGNDDYGPALAHPDGGLSGSLEAVYGGHSPVVWSA